MITVVHKDLLKRGKETGRRARNRFRTGRFNLEVKSDNQGSRGGFQQSEWGSHGKMCMWARNRAGTSQQLLEHCSLQGLCCRTSSAQRLRLKPVPPQVNSTVTVCKAVRFIQRFANGALKVPISRIFLLTNKNLFWEKQVGLNETITCLGKQLVVQPVIDVSFVAVLGLLC